MEFELKYILFNLYLDWGYTIFITIIVGAASWAVYQVIKDVMGNEP